MDKGKKLLRKTVKRIKKEWNGVLEAMHHRLKGLDDVGIMYQGFWLACVHEVRYYLTEEFPSYKPLQEEIVGLYNTAPKDANVFLNLINAWFNAENLFFDGEAFREQVRYETKRYKDEQDV